MTARRSAQEERSVDFRIGTQDVESGVFLATHELSDVLEMRPAAFGVGPDVAAEMLIVSGDNPQRIRSEAAFAKLCGDCPIPASSGVIHRHRLFRGGHRQANAALHRVALVRCRWHAPTIAYATRRKAEGLSKRDITRCLKRFIAREIYHALLADHQHRADVRDAIAA